MHVLVVDDEADVRNYVGYLLHKAGFTVNVAGDGNAAWELIEFEIPDIILCDINMPQVNGFELLERVRKTPETDTIPFLFITSRSDRDGMRTGMELGADDYITKPFSEDELLGAMKSCFYKRSKIDGKHRSTIKLLKKHITYALPHEMRTPLNTIMGYAEMLMLDYQTMDRNDIYSMAEVIVRSSQRLHRLMERSLIYAQIEVIGANEEERDKLRNFIIPSASNIIQSRAEAVAERNHRVEDLQIQLDDRALQIAEDNLANIIDELVDNACKFSEPGTPIVVRTVKKTNSYTILIRDSGRGMSERQIRDIGAYIQFDRAVYEQQGIGLELAIAKRLVELHNGTIEIKSVEGRGTLVAIDMPV